MFAVNFQNERTHTERKLQRPFSEERANVILFLHGPLIEPHFSILTIPSLNLKVEKSQFKSILNDMYNKNLENDGIFFKKPNQCFERDV